MSLNWVKVFLCCQLTASGLASVISTNFRAQWIHLGNEKTHNNWRSCTCHSPVDLIDEKNIQFWWFFNRSGFVNGAFSRRFHSNRFESNAWWVNYSDGTDDSGRSERTQQTKRITAFWKGRYTKSCVPDWIQVGIVRWKEQNLGHKLGYSRMVCGSTSDASERFVFFSCRFILFECAAVEMKEIVVYSTLNLCDSNA